jgi:hypothetical protein
VVGAIVEVVVVVLPGVGHVPAPHASQQLDTVPTHALPPRGALQAAAPCLTLHLVVPCASVRQHVTEFFLPQVELDAHCITESWHADGSEPSRTAAFATCAAHLTWRPWLEAPAQSHCASTIARTAASAAA